MTPKSDHIVLGIDPGSRNTGVAVLKKSGSRFEMLYCTVLNVGKHDSHVDRLKEIYEEVTNVITRFSPESLAIETPLYGKDPLALLKLGRAQAASILAAVNSGIPVEEYYPKMVKKSITGNGNATKDQVAYMLDKVLNLNGEKFPADGTDALAVAWCHLMRDTPAFQNQIKQPQKKHQNHARSGWEVFLAENPDRVKG